MSSHETVDGADDGLSRRKMLKTAGLAAGAAWVVPSVLTLSASPAAASPLGCLDCGQPIFINGAGTDTAETGWTAVGNGWNSTGTVYQGSSGASFSRSTRDRPIYNFSAECVSRFAIAPPTQPQVQLTLAGNLRGNTGNIITSFLEVNFFSLPNAGGANLGTASLTSTSGSLTAITPTVQNIPIGTQSMTIRLALARSNVGNPGQGQNLTLTVGAC